MATKSIYRRYQMKRWISSGLVAVVLLIAMLVACAPKAAPAPAPAPAAPAIPAPASPAVSPEETAWAQVVEAAKKEGTVTMYTAVFTGESTVTLARAFKEKYGITANLMVGTGSVLSQRVVVETRAKQNIVDLAEISSGYMGPLQREGLLISMGALPALRDRDIFWIPPQMEPEINAVQFEFITTGMGINTRLIQPGDEPKSYLDLLKPKYKGKMGMDDPVLNSSPTQLYVWLRNNQVLPNVDEYYRGLAKQDVKIIVSKLEVYAALIRGDIAIAFAFIGNRRLAVDIVKGAPVKPIGPEEGVAVVSEALALVKGAPHPNAAKLLSNWLLSAEGQTVYAKALGASSIRKDVPDFLPPGARMKITRALLTDTKQVLDVDKLMREQYVAGIFGVKR